MNKKNITILTILTILGFLISTMGLGLGYQGQREANNELMNINILPIQESNWDLGSGEILFALNQSFYDDAGGQRNYGQVGYVWNFTSTGPVSFLLLNSTYLENFYNGSIYEIRNVISDYGHSKIPESPRERYHSPTGQFYFYLIFWNEGDTSINIDYEVKRYEKTPVISLSLEESNPDWVFTTEEAAEYLGAILSGNRSHPITPPPAANRTYLSEDFNLTIEITSEFVDWSPSQYFYNLKGFSIHGEPGNGIDNYPSGDFYENSFNITVDVSFLGRGWLLIQLQCNLKGLVDNTTDWMRWIYLHP